jgi:hypothetical protein
LDAVDLFENVSIEFGKAMGETEAEAEDEQGMTGILLLPQYWQLLK